MKLLILISSIILTQSIFSQSITVLDSTNLNPLPYSSISYKEIGEKSIIQVSHLGYKFKTIENIKPNDTVLLNPVSYELGEVAIDAGKSVNSYELGCPKYRRISPHTFSIDVLNKRAMSAVMINQKNVNDIIEGVNLPVRNTSETSKFKLYLLSVGSDGLPQDTILKKLLNANEFKKDAFINLWDHHLNIPEKGLFVAFEWWSTDIDVRSQMQIVISKKYDQNLSYMYYKDKWIPFKEYFDEKDWYQNFAFSVKLMEN